MAREKLSSEVRLEIEKLIGTEFKKGDRIPSEEELCARFNVSRATVREAIRELVSAHVLKIRRGVGTFVTEHPGLVEDPFGAKFMEENKLQEDIWETSILLEPQFAEWVAERAEPGQIDEIAEIQNRYEEAYLEWKKNPSDEMTEQLFRLDGEFHLKIAKSTGNLVLYYIFRGYCRMINNEMDYKLAKKNIGSIRKYHPLLIQDFRNHDGASAKQHMLEHDRELKDINLKAKRMKER